MRKDLPDIIRGIVDNGMRFSIISNGTLITENIAFFLANTSRCDKVQVSVDGPNAKIHETARSKGSFNAAIRGIKYLQKCNIPVDIRTTIHKNNVAHLKDTIQYILEDLSIPAVSTNAVFPAGLCGSGGRLFQLNIEERSQAMNTFCELLSIYKGRIKATAGPLAQIRAWSQETVPNSSGSISSGNGYLSGCGCVFSSISVRADGIIVPCNFLDEIELGMINQDSLEKIWQSHPEILRLRKRRAVPLTGFDSCRDCFYVDHCTGDCPGQAFLYSKDIYVPDTNNCLKTFLINGGKVPNVDAKLFQ